MLTLVEKKNPDWETSLFWLERLRTQADVGLADARRGRLIGGQKLFADRDTPGGRDKHHFALTRSAHSDLEEMIREVKRESGVVHALCVYGAVAAASVSLVRGEPLGVIRYGVAREPICLLKVGNYFLVYRSVRRPVQLVRILPQAHETELALHTLNAKIEADPGLHGMRVTGIEYHALKSSPVPQSKRKLKAMTSR
jgi:hypothetical protein